MANADPLDAYFQCADTDHDGRISGREAVTFFQRANLSREVLAKIWQYADHGQKGFLSRAEFYNALKLVTVAQTGRELTPAIVRNALNGPASSQIPPPKLQFASGQLHPVRPQVDLPDQQLQQFAAAGAAQQPAPTPPQTTLGLGGASDWPISKLLSWPSPGTSNDLAGAVPQARAVAPASFPQTTSDSFTVQAGGWNSIDHKAPASGPQVQPWQPSLASQPHMMAPQERGPQIGSSVFASSSAASEMLSQQVFSVPTAVRPHTQDHGLAGPTLAGIDSSKCWPRMSDSVVNRYTKIFLEVDTDKDGKISGTQARELFLSWHLPREVLKQVWDLADRDHDSMLSLQEFCIALYFMERFREGRTLSAPLAEMSYLDESGLQALRIAETQVALAQKSAGYNVPTWHSNPGILKSPGSGLLPRPIILPQGQELAPSSALGGSVRLQSRQPLTGPGGTSVQPILPRPRALGLEMNQMIQVNADDQLITKHQGAVYAEKKVQELEKQIMDSKEKMEFYRTKLQETVLFKTRCDNRLAEITDRAASDKREVEAMAKRYGEKFKHARESHSCLLADEAAFRDMQERKSELYTALLQMEKGGNTNALLQTRADRLHSDLDEIRKVLNVKCKHLGLHIKPISILEIPFGWQPGLQENAAQWDDEWDKFEDEGFVYVKEFMEEGTAGSEAAKPKIVRWEEYDAAEEDIELFSSNGEIMSEGSMPKGTISQHAHGGNEVNSNGDANSHDTSPSSQGPMDLGVSDNRGEDKREPQSNGHGLGSYHFDDAVADNGEDWASAFTHSTDDRNSPAWMDSQESSGSIFKEKKQNLTGFAFNDPAQMLSSSNSFRNGGEDLPSLMPIRTKQSPLLFDSSIPSTPQSSVSSPSYSSHSKGGSVLFDNSVLNTPAWKSTAGPFNSSHTKESSVFFDESAPSTPAWSSITSPFDNYGGGRDVLSRFDSFSSSVTDFDHASSRSFAQLDSFRSSQDIGSVTRSFTSFDASDPSSCTGHIVGSQSTNRSTDTWDAFH